MNVLLWFKRDLRIHDHPALARAAAAGPVLPVYIAEPALWAQADTSARQWAFVAESLACLRDDLAGLGLSLAVRRGDAVEVLAALARAHRIGRIVSHEETGNLWTYGRDRRVAAWARGAGIAWDEVPQSGVIRRLARRDGWAARRDAFVALPQVTVAQVTPVAGVEPGLIPDARALGLAPDRCPHRQRGGRAAGRDLMEGFLSRRGQDYRRAMSSPLSAEGACSRLSPHLAHGTLSVREVAQAAAARAAEHPGDGWSGALRSFAARLAWRDHFAQKLEDQPSIEIRCLDPAAEGLRGDSDPARLAAWAAGETGLPFVDACMRYLNATGWINFRMRAMLMAVGSYHLWLDWRQTGPVLARAFTDYDPGIHWPQVQMQSGTTAINTIRIYNPVKQGHDQDPDGRFIRRWVPELAAVPDAFVHEPWRWPGADAVLGRRYPQPVVDPVAAARAARDAVWALRRVPGHAATAAAIADRHASRADARFVNDRSPRPRRRSGAKGAEARQMSLDL